MTTHIRTPPHITLLEEEEAGNNRTPERETVEERLVNNIPTPPPSLVPCTNRLILNLKSGEAGSLGGSRAGEQSLVPLSSMVRTKAQRLKLC